MPFPAALAISAIPSVFQAFQGVRQRRLAENLKESTFIPPELQNNQALARMQANSRRAPGQAAAEENIRRNLATTIGAQSRMYGGDANKAVSLVSSAQGRANDAMRGLAAQAQSFSEDAYRRLYSANAAVAGQRRQNRDEYNRAKESLLSASDQNLFNAASNLSSTLLTGAIAGKDAGGFGKGLPQNNPWNDYLRMRNYQPGMIDLEQNGYGVWSYPGFAKVNPRVNQKFN